MSAPRVAAVVFDLDGTLVDNQQYHLLAWQQMARERSISLTPERFDAEIAGRRNEEILPTLFGRSISAAEMAELGERKETIYRDLVRSHVTETAGASALMGELLRQGIPMALASAAPAANRELVLAALGWSRRFAAIIGAEDVEHGKPAPDFYLAAALALQVPPQRAVAFEDSVPGVASAAAAGMRVCGILSGPRRSLLEAAGASWTAVDFAHLPAALLEEALTAAVIRVDRSQA